jgi:cyclophilin family peptidyl-prolyl cis-trans isomerase
LAEVFEELGTSHCKCSTCAALDQADAVRSCRRRASPGRVTGSAAARARVGWRADRGRAPWGRSARVCGALALLLVAAVSCTSSSEPTPAERPASPAASTPRPRAAAWGPPPPADGRYLADELAREISIGLREGLAAADLEQRRAALWSIARIGGEAARAALAPLATDAALRGELAAFGLLERDLDDADATSVGEWSDLEDALWSRFALATDDGERDAIAFALGRVAGPRVLPWFAGALAAAGEDAVEAARSSRAIGLLCARNVRIGAAERDVLIAALAERGDVARGDVARALARCIRSSSETFASDKPRAKAVASLSTIVAAAVEDTAGWELQHAAWRAHAALGELPASIPPGVLGEAPPPPWVEAEAVRAITVSAEGRRQAIVRVLSASPDAFVGARANVFLELARGLRAHASEDAVAGEIPRLAARIREVLGERQGEASARDRHALGLIACELAVLEAATTGDLAAVERCSAGIDSLPADTGRVFAVEAAFWANPPSGRGPILEALLRYAEDPSTRVAAAAMSALAEIDDPRVNAVLRDALIHRDVGVRTAAAGSIAVRAVDANRRDVEAVAALEGLVTVSTKADALEARLAAIDALGVLARSAEVRVQAPAAEVAADPVAAATVVASRAGTQAAPWLERTLLPLAEDGAAAVRAAARAALRDREDLRITFDATARRVPLASFTASAPPDLATPPQGAAPVALRVETTAGTFTIDLTRAPSPIAQAHLVALARDGFFEGIAWHRVVPGFVAQTGDPRGDGYGGPGHTMPCEWSNLAYQRGTVGIALAGRDTGGSQWFVTTSPQPHLDGRFTVVGHVSEGPEGMAVVDALLPWDTIRRVEVIEATSGAGLGARGEDRAAQDPT